MQNFLRGYLPFILGLMFSATALAGGTSSGGGAVIRDADNPWFVTNTKKIYYCVDMDEVNFGLTAAQANQSFQEAVSFWKREFASSGGDLHLDLTQQDFVFAPCDEQTDIRLQLGRLTASQRLLLEPKDFISSAVRSAYDSVHLKGRGFIYVTPQSGPQRIIDQGLSENLWSRHNGYTLTYIFAHELGHIIGIPHNSNGSETDLMHVDFPDYIAHIPEKGLTYALHNTFKPGYFNFVSDEDSNCFSDDRQVVQQSYFGIQGAYDCLKVEMQRQGFDVFVIRNRSANTDWEKIGSGTLTNDSKAWDVNTAISIFLTPQQKVYDFNSISPNNVTIHDQPYYVTETLSGTYTSVDGKTLRQALVQFRPRSSGTRSPFTLSGALETRIIPDILH